MGTSKRKILIICTPIFDLIFISIFNLDSIVNGGGGIGFNLDRSKWSKRGELEVYRFSLVFASFVFERKIFNSLVKGCFFFVSSDEERGAR